MLEAFPIYFSGLNKEQTVLVLVCFFFAINIVEKNFKLLVLVPSLALFKHVPSYILLYIQSCTCSSQILRVKKTHPCIFSGLREKGHARCVEHW